MNLLDQIKNAKPTILDHKSLMENLQESLNSRAVNEDANLEIKELQDFWKEQLNVDSEVTKEFLTERAKQTFRKITDVYLIGDEYQEYKKHLRPKETQEIEESFSESERLSAEQGSLFDDVITKIDQGDSEVPALMYEIISFFDKVSKQTLENQKHLLAQFPPQNKNDYQCAGGSQTRLVNVKIQMDDDLDQSFNALIEKESPKLLKLISLGSQVHLHALLQKSLGLTSNDKLWHCAVNESKAEDIWHFVRSLNEELNKVHQDRIALARGKIENIAKIFDQIKVDETGKIISGVSEATAAVKNHGDILGVSSGLDFERKFFEFDDGYFPFKFKMNGQVTVIEQKLKDLTEEIKTLLEYKNEEIFNFELHDTDAPQKIVEILQNPNPNLYQKNIALSALWILSEDFAGNSPINFARTLKIMKNNENETLDVSSSKSLINLTAEIILNIGKNRTHKIRQYMIDNQIDDGETIPTKCCVELEIPQEALEYCELEGEGNVFLKIFDKLMKRPDFISLIFYHPQRNQILDLIEKHKDSLYFTDENGQNNQFTSGYIGAYVKRYLIEISVKKQDKDLFERLMVNQLKLEITQEEFCHNFSIAVELENKELAGKLYSHLSQDSIAQIFILEADKNNLKMVKYLINNGFNIDHQGQAGWNALMLASKGGYLDMVNLLIKNGANLDLTNDSGYSALMIVSRMTRMNVIKTLLENNSNVNIQGHENGYHGQTALAIAAQWGKLETVELLARRVDDINHKDSLGLTVIDIASKFGYSQVVDLLLNKVNEESKFSALNIAISKQIDRSEVCSLIWDNLHENGINEDQSGNSFAHLIVIGSNQIKLENNKQSLTDAIGILFTKEYFNPMKEDVLGRTAIELAFETDEKVITKIMFEKLSITQQIETLNRTTTNGKGVNLGSLLLEVIEENLDCQIQQFEPSSVKSSSQNMSRESEGISQEPVTQQLKDQLYKAVKENIELKKNPSHSAIIGKISRLQKMVIDKEKN
ncbi:MAG: ankyrin repeat protein [Lentimonas sp.]|jgi:ankyrin repeat protein